jgi:hypothetical protein
MSRSPSAEITVSFSVKDESTGLYPQITAKFEGSKLTIETFGPGDAKMGVTISTIDDWLQANIPVRLLRRICRSISSNPKFDRHIDFGNCAEIIDKSDEELPLNLSIENLDELTIWRSFKIAVGLAIMVATKLEITGFTSVDELYQIVLKQQGSTTGMKKLYFGWILKELKNYLTLEKVMDGNKNGKDNKDCKDCGGHGGHGGHNHNGNCNNWNSSWWVWGLLLLILVIILLVAAYRSGHRM